MSIIAVLGGIVSTIGKVVGVAGSIFKIARPILEAMRGPVEEIDEGLEWLEKNATKIGEGADDFLDRNIKTVTDLESASGRAIVFFGKLNQLAGAMRVASQENTPDTIDEEEAANFIRLIGELKEAKVALSVDVDTSIASMKEAEAEMDKMGG